MITGIQAAGKSTVAQGVAERHERAVHIRGDAFRRMIVSGRVEMGAPDPPEEAIAQLQLRYRLAAMVAETYAQAGFTVVLQDIVIGADLPRLVGAIHHRPLPVVVLAPSVEAIAARERGRSNRKIAYRPGSSCLHARFPATVPDAPDRNVA